MPQTEEKIELPPFTAVILAGGQASRMSGEDKGLIQINGKNCIEYVIEALQPHTQSILINANRNIPQYQQWGYPVIEDRQQGFLGPLAGIESALIHSPDELIITVPCDAPLIQADFASRLLQHMIDNKYDACIADDGDNLQPVFTLLRKNLLTSLHDFIAAGGRKTRTWLLSLSHCIVDYSDHPEQFFNMNSPADRARLQGLLKTDN